MVFAVKLETDLGSRTHFTGTVILFLMSIGESINTGPKYHKSHSRIPTLGRIMGESANPKCNGEPCPWKPPSGPRSPLCQLCMTQSFQIKDTQVAILQKHSITRAAHASNSSTQEEPGGLLKIWDHLALHSEFRLASTSN